MFQSSQSNFTPGKLERRGNLEGAEVRFSSLPYKYMVTRVDVGLGVLGNIHVVHILPQ